MRPRLRRPAGLTVRDARFLLQAAAALLAVDVALRLLPFGRVRAWAARHRQAPARSAGDVWPTVECVQRWVGSAAYHFPYPMPCLRRALATQWLLGRRGIPTSLQFGVRKGGAGLAAHAWLEFEGRPIGEPAAVEERFSPLA